MAGWQPLLQMRIAARHGSCTRSEKRTRVDLRRMPIRFIPGPYWQLPGQPPLLTGGSTGLMLQRSAAGGAAVGRQSGMDCRQPPAC